MFHKSITAPARNLLTRLLSRDKSERPASAAEVKRDPFFHDVEWDRLLRKEVPAPFVPDIGDDDTKYFDELFTAEAPVLSVCPAPDPRLNLHFVGFSYHGAATPEAK